MTRAALFRRGNAPRIRYTLCMSRLTARAYRRGVGSGSAHHGWGKTLAQIRDDLAGADEGRASLRTLRGLVLTILAGPQGLEVDCVALQAELAVLDHAVAAGDPPAMLLQCADPIVRRLSLALFGEIWVGVQPRA